MWCESGCSSETWPMYFSLISGFLINDSFKMRMTDSVMTDSWSSLETEASEYNKSSLFWPFVWPSHCLWAWSFFLLNIQSSMSKVFFSSSGLVFWSLFCWWSGFTRLGWSTSHCGWSRQGHPIQSSVFFWWDYRGDPAKCARWERVV